MQGIRRGKENSRAGKLLRRKEFVRVGSDIGKKEILMEMR